MKLKHNRGDIPERTAAVAKKAFKKGNRYVEIRDELGDLFADEQWSELFSDKGRPGESPGQLAMLLVLQYLENLSDRQVAEQLGARLDWKYLLGMELEAEGIRFQKLSEFRERLVSGNKSEIFLDKLLQELVAKGWLKEAATQRTDATWISSVGRRLNRLELVWEALSLLVEELAWRVPKWLSRQIEPRWVEFYARPLGWRQMPKKKAEQEQLALDIGRDGYRLWDRFIASAYCEEWWELPKVEAFRQIWLQQYYRDEEGVTWRKPNETPAAAIGIATPFDLEARFSRQEHSSGHVGYQVHFTETVAGRKELQVITDVTTTPATTVDKQMVLPIQDKLAARELAPKTHLVDAGYISSGNLVQSQKKHQIHLQGPVPSNSNWQKRAAKGYDSDHFRVDWEQNEVTHSEIVNNIVVDFIRKHAN
jgi:transposase